MSGVGCCLISGFLLWLLAHAPTIHSFSIWSSMLPNGIKTGFQEQISQIHLFAIAEITRKLNNLTKTTISGHWKIIKSKQMLEKSLLMKITIVLCKHQDSFLTTELMWLRLFLGLIEEGLNSESAAKFSRKG